MFIGHIIRAYPSHPSQAALLHNQCQNISAEAVKFSNSTKVESTLAPMG